MKYFIYGTTFECSKWLIDGLVKENTEVYKNILSFLGDCQDRYLHESKIRLVEGFENIFIYDKKLSDEDLEECNFTYIGNVKYSTDYSDNCLPFMIICLNDELKAESVNLELTTIECDVILEVFADIEMYGVKHEMEKSFINNYRLLKETLWKIKEALEEVEE